MAVKQCLCIIACLLSASLAFSQQLVKGKVLDATTGRPLSAISVYLNNTSIGTTTNAKGEFTIDHIPPAKYKLVVSGISYQTFSKLIDTHDSIGYITVQLTREADLLNGTEVRLPDPNGWKKWGELFTNLFVGTFPYADECTIQNHEVLKFRLNDDNTLTIYAEKPIQLHNALLGYDITYKLEEFTYDFSASIVSFSGSVLFKDLTLARLSAKANTWRQNRLAAYNGSVLHFMRSFYADRLKEEGFEMHSLANIPNRDKQRARQLFAKETRILDTVSSELDDSSGVVGRRYTILDSTDYFKNALLQSDSIISHQFIPEDSVAFVVDSTIAGFYFPDSLEVSYTRKETSAVYRHRSPETRNQIYPVSQFVFVNKVPVYVLSNGFHYGLNDLKITGFWAWSETLATLLPYDYQPSP